MSPWRRRQPEPDAAPTPPTASVSPDSVLAGSVVAPWQTLVSPDKLDMDKKLVDQIRAELTKARTGGLSTPADDVLS